MKKKNGFTMFEVLVTGVIVTIFAAMIAGAFRWQTLNEDTDGNSPMFFVSPEIENARSQRKIAEELAKQNRLIERRLELLEAQGRKAEAE